MKKVLGVFLIIIGVAIGLGTLFSILNLIPRLLGSSAFDASDIGYIVGYCMGAFLTGLLAWWFIKKGIGLVKK